MNTTFGGIEGNWSTSLGLCIAKFLMCTAVSRIAMHALLDLLFRVVMGSDVMFWGETGVEEELEQPTQYCSPMPRFSNPAPCPVLHFGSS
jgi:hypothetical protein